MKTKLFDFPPRTILLLALLGLASGASGSDLEVAQPGQKSGSGLSSKKSGVPSFNWSQKNKKAVPLLEVGLEPQLKVGTPQALLVLPEPPAFVMHKLPALPQVDLKAYDKPIAKIELRHLLNVQLGSSNEVKDLAPAPVAKVDERSENPRVVQSLTPAEEQLLQALIYIDIHKSYPLALGLLAELLQTELPENLKSEVEYHYARALLAWGIPGEHRHYLTHLLRTTKNKDLSKRVAIELARNAQADDLVLVPELDKKIDDLDLDWKKDLIGADQYSLNRTRYYSDEGDLGAALAAADEISLTSPLAPQALFLKGVLNYRAGHIPEAEALLTDVVHRNEKLEANSDFKSSAALTLARLQFQQGNYKGAFQTYLQVGKGNPLWMQAMVEQAWAQILTEDYEGAAGNMYTLHTDFFKNAFAPESYVTRAVGYLNLCQYGDGAKVIYSVNHRYGPMKAMLEQYQAKNKTDQAYYETVRSFFKNPELKNIDGLYRNFVYELARHPGFMALQKNVNSIEDQISRYNNLSLELVKWERELLQKQTDAEKKIEQLQLLAQKKNEPDHQKEIDHLKESVASLKIQYQSAHHARASLRDFRTPGIQRFEKTKVELKQQAAKVLRMRFSEMVASVTKVLDQAEVLRYEIYAGAGEHLRFQLAGGQISDKEREVLKVQENKAQKWEFIGEVWEDELGHYRSSLKNVCPATNQRAKEGDNQVKSTEGRG